MTDRCILRNPKAVASGGLVNRSINCILSSHVRIASPSGPWCLFHVDLKWQWKVEIDSCNVQWLSSDQCEWCVSSRFYHGTPNQTELSALNTCLTAFLLRNTPIVQRACLSEFLPSYLNSMCFSFLFCCNILWNINSAMLALHWNGLISHAHHSMMSSYEELTPF